MVADEHVSRRRNRQGAKSIVAPKSQNDVPRSLQPFRGLGAIVDSSVVVSMLVFATVPLIDPLNCPPCPQCGSVDTVVVQTQSWHPAAYVCVNCGHIWTPPAITIPLP